MHITCAFIHYLMLTFLTQFDRVEFSEIQTFITAESSVYYMEEDLLDVATILYTSGCSLNSVTVDSMTFLPLAGIANSCGYLESVGTDSRFTTISSFVQLNVSVIVATDLNNHCLRIIDRATYTTSAFAGHCGTSGYANGRNSLFNRPWLALRHSNISSKLLITDEQNHALRELNMDTMETVALATSENGLKFPTGMTYCWGYANCVLTVNEHFISSYNFDTRNVTLIAGDASPGHADRELKMSKFYYPIGIVTLSPHIILVTDYSNRRLRILNISSDSVSSFCRGYTGSEDGPSWTCSLNYPISLLKKNGTLYIGEKGAIRMISGTEYFAV